jgi:hypothetical protein
MVIIAINQCRADGCTKPPKFNYKYETRGLYCTSHKLDKMTNIYSNPCQHIDCLIGANYNYKNKSLGMYCFKHKLNEMINLGSNICQHLDCTTIPNFNYIDKTVGIFCDKHKLNEMINVVDKKCQHKNCTTIPCFNKIGSKTGIFCSKHKLNEMIDVRHIKCHHTDCTIIPYFNVPSETVGIFCYNHKLKDMTNVTRQMCKTHLCDEYSNIKYKGYCTRCFVYMFPNEPNSRNYKQKEIYVRDYVLQEFIYYTWICDKRIIDGCSKRRPDMLLDLGDKIIIVEIDENQHTSYDSSCELARLNNLSEDVKYRPIVLIKFNPDKYLNENNILIKSPWDINITYQICDQIEIDNRLLTLKNTIKLSIKQTFTELLTIIPLFYDNNDNDDTDGSKLTPLDDQHTISAESYIDKIA